MIDWISDNLYIIFPTLLLYTLFLIGVVTLFSIASIWYADYVGVY